MSGNTLYGTAQQGGSSGNGTVFKVNTNGMGLTNLHSFTATPPYPGPYINGDGAYPFAGLIISGSTLYGTAVYGGSSGNGTVFAINTDGTGFTNLYSFTATYTNSSGFYTNSDGVYPHDLILSGGTLYGTASHGGSSGNGTVFAVNTNGTGFRNPHSFTARDPTTGTNSDGAYPRAALTLSGNTLYGTAVIGGSSGAGTMFAVNTDATGFTTLHSFDGSDGAHPGASLILSGNTLYGTTESGGVGSGVPSGDGTVFSLSFTPQLTITPSGPNVILSWPTNVAGFDYTGYTLQSTTIFVSPAFWAPVSPAPVVLNGQNTVTNSISGNCRFYRLVRSGHQTWAKVADMPTGRDSLGAAAGADGRIYAIGGLGDSGPLDTVEAYTPGSWATMARMPTARYGHAVVAGKDGLIYAIGGLALSGVTATLEVYTPSTDSWATATSMPTAPLVFAAATTADRLTTYAIGGIDGSGGQTVEAFTPNAGAGTWANKASMPTASYALAAAWGADGRIYAIGGDGGAFNLDTVEAYTPSTDSWVTVPSMPTPRSYLAATAGADGRIYAIGGQDGPNAVGATVEVYTP